VWLMQFDVLKKKKETNKQTNLKGRVDEQAAF
jgi:hypothetical protein